MNHVPNLCNQATALFNLSHDEWRSIKLERTSSLWWRDDDWLLDWARLISGSSSDNSGSWSVGSRDQNPSFLVRNWGPFSHLLFAHISSTVRPLLTSSAGLSSELMCLHWWGAEFSWITESLFATNVWNLFDWFLLYCNKQVESYQYVDCVIGMFNSSRTDLSNWTAKTAAESSSLGTVIGFRCARLGFQMRNVQWILSLTSTILRY